MKKTNISFCLLVLFAALILCAGCGEEISTDGSSSGSLWGPSDDTTETPTAAPTESYLTPATPFSTPKPTPVGSVTAQPTQDQSAPQYFTIYDDSISFMDEDMYKIVSYQYDLSYAPMIINLKIRPEMVDDIKTGTSSYGEKEEYETERQLVHDNADFSLTIYDVYSKEVFDFLGYGKTYSDFSEEKELKIRMPGLYQLEMTGAHVEVDVTIEVAGENIQ